MIIWYKYNYIKIISHNITIYRGTQTTMFFFFTVAPKPEGPGHADRRLFSKATSDLCSEASASSPNHLWGATTCGDQWRPCVVGILLFCFSICFTFFWVMFFFPMLSHVCFFLGVTLIAYFQKIISSFWMKICQAKLIEYSSKSAWDFLKGTGLAKRPEFDVRRSKYLEFLL